MYARRRYKLIGLLYLTPALLFVLAFTAYPLIQMAWVSLNSWTLITPPKFIGFNNFIRAFNDAQFWVSLGYTLKYTLLITPILMIGGYLLALLVSPNTPLRRFTRAVIFVPVVIGLGVSSLLWVWLFDPDVRLHQPVPVRHRPHRKADPMARDRRRRLHVGDHHVRRLEGARFRHDPVRRRDPGHPDRDQ